MQSQILPSRAALVDRIAMQFEYGQNLICLVGNSGLGKSYLAESFITDKYPEFNKAFVKLGAHTKDTELVQQLLENSFRAPLVDHKLSLTENFFVLYNEQPCGPCLWVIDGARHLSDELIQELQLLAKKAPDTLYILITAQAPKILPEALDIHLEPLSLVESRRLMAMFFQQLPPQEDPIFSTFLHEAGGNPSILLEWQQNQHQLTLKSKPTLSRKQLNLFLGAFVVITTLFLVAVVYQKDLADLLRMQQDVAATQVEELPEPTVLTTQQALSDNDSQSADDVAAEQSSDDTQAAVQHDVQSILGALTVSHSTQDGNQTNEPEKDSGNKIANGEESDQVTGQVTGQITDAPTVVAQALTQETAAEEPEATGTQEQIETPQPAGVSEQPGDLSDNIWFMAQDSNAWTIQLLAVTDQAVAQRYVAQHKLAQIRIAQVKRNNKDWWFVTLAPFATLDDAKQARANLPQAVLAGQPFFKRIVQIKQQIQQSQTQK
ncbi:SPOR domain-containing protein [Pseudoalteromonas sp. DL2-H2.2]|uniref:SPOR domain-containing protein n=1 Tax=Pseudoalteromonas sp. DL2-H2.2 TaxID=2908889 RepID=UPI001F1705EB|nr:SPOR domain-containing protein [Pseudoalteromonas sp. DL2-H2.2]MCF2910265.1 SPOR domain-containing protein [Pseudoalteromonas sp. DL2-H2.2]